MQVNLSISGERHLVHGFFAGSLEFVQVSSPCIQARPHSAQGVQQKESHFGVLLQSLFELTMCVLELLIEELESLYGVCGACRLKVTLRVFAQEAVDLDRFISARHFHSLSAHELYELFQRLHAFFIEVILVEFLKVGG